ncbi:hypothetical protein [Nevskia ramosa]|uniref:hypothetical protein n=1 Tax=Nevskia ramosa TaxID=64002 RepID=UPI0012EC319E|nr:hypothetical protein [Nevskia ramosa]
MITVLASVAATGMMATVHADLPDEFAVCKGIVDNGTRLSCFDALTLPSDHAPVAPTSAIDERAASVQPKASTTVRQQPLSGATAFGAESVPKAIVDQPKSLKAKVLGNIRGIRKGLLIQLDNGQQWRSVDDRDYDYEADSPEVTIDRNVIGTYWMAFPNSGIRIRARRIK